MHARRQFIGQLLGLSGTVAGAAAAASAAEPGVGSQLVLDVRGLGAAGDGTQLDTTPLQQAIDQCSQAGGGIVFVPAGRYLIGTLFLKSHVCLHLDAGAVLLGSPNLKDYPTVRPAIRSFTDTYTEKSLLYGENIEDFRLEGQGKIDGQGDSFKGPYLVRPYLVRFVSCRDLAIRDLCLQNSPMWVQHYLACDRVQIDGIRVDSRCNANNDGIDIDGCRQVRISHCSISSGDDAIVLKSTLDRPCQDVVITNCLLSSDCNAFKLGTESNGGFENITLSNCSIYQTGLAGLALELVDGGRLDGVTISNVTMREVQAPIFIRLGNRARSFQPELPPPGLGVLRNISITNVQATGANRVGCSITGLPEAMAESISLDQIRIQFAGGGTTAEAERPIPERAEAYPEYGMFGPLPAYGLFCRHARNLRLSNFQFTFKEPDARPAVVCEDVEGLDVCGGSGAVLAETKALFWLKAVRGAFIHGCRVPAAAATFLRIDGASTRRVRVIANDLAEGTKQLELGPDVPPNAVVAAL